jgi:hypothetical protein
MIGLSDGIVNTQAQTNLAEKYQQGCIKYYTSLGI